MDTILCRGELRELMSSERDATALVSLPAYQLLGYVGEEMMLTTMSSP